MNEEAIARAAIERCEELMMDCTHYFGTELESLALKANIAAGNLRQALKDKWGMR